MSNYNDTACLCPHKAHAYYTGADEHKSDDDGWCDNKLIVNEFHIDDIAYC